MTVYRFAEIACDECNDDIGITALTAGDIRDIAKKEHGWHVGRSGGRDMCKSCWEKGLR